MFYVHLSVHLDHRFSLIYGQDFSCISKTGEKHISFHQSVLLVENIKKMGRLTNSIILEYPGESCILVFLS